MAGYRREFDGRLDAIEAKVMELFVVCDDLPAVTQAMLNGNDEPALCDRRP